MLATVLIAASASHANEAPEPDLVADPFLEAQAEIRAAVASIAEDVMAPNIEALKAIHLDSPKFSKFGPRSFERQDVTSTNESEASFFTSISNLNYEVQDLKVDVFGVVGVATYRYHATFDRSGQAREVQGRQTLVFVRVADEWKIAHEHGTVKWDD